MTLKKRTTGSPIATFEQSRVNRSGSQSSPLLTPLALLLLGAVQMARAQAEQAQPALSVADAPSDNPQGELFADADQPAQVPAGSAVVSEATPAELLALLQSLADSARESADALVQEAGEGAAQQTQAGEAASVAQATVDRLGQLDRAEAVLEAYQNVIDQLPADLVLAQAPAAAAGAEAAGAAGAASTAGAAAAAAGGLSAGTMLAGLLGLAAIGAGGGGGGGGSGATPAAAATTEVTLHDGYIDGARVYVDLNDSGVIDSGDKFVGTTINGKLKAELSASDKLHALIAQGGTDISTGSAFGGSFSTTAGSTVINPLSTLVQTLVQATVDAVKNLPVAEKDAAVAQAKADAMAVVSAALGIESDVDLTQLDTVGASSGNTSGGTTEIVVGFDEADAIALHSKALMVANLISMGAAAMAGAAAASGDTTTGTADFSKFVVQGIVNSVKAAASSGESVSFGSAESVKQMLDGAVDAAKTAGKALDDAAVDNASDKVAGAVSVTNQLIGAYAADAAKAVATPGAAPSAGTTGLTQMLQVQKAVLNQAEGLKTGSGAALAKLDDLSDTSKALDAAKNVTGLKIGTKDASAVAVVPTGDMTAPTVTSIDVRPARVGDLAQVVVKMSESVLVKPGTDGQFATLSITTSAADANSAVTATASLDPGLSSGDTVVFTYRVQPGDVRVAVASGASISLPAGASIKDLAGNAANPAIASGKAVVVDSIAPMVSISSDAAFVKAGATATVTFTLSEAPSTRTAGAFAAEDVTVKNGTLSGFAQDANNPLKYTAKVAVTNASAPAEVGISGGKFTDAAGNGNLPSNVVLVAQEGAAPVVAVSSDQSFFNTVNTPSGTASTVLRFSLSGASTDFTADDVTIAGPGTLSGFTGSGKEYSATLTGMTSETKVSVIKDAFSVSGTTAKNVASNALGFKVDTDKPTVSIEVLKGASGTEAVTSGSTLKAGDSARVKFTFLEEVQGFGPQSVKVMGGYLDNFAKVDSKTYTAVFKPAPPEAGQTGSVEARISVDAKRFSDLAGNPNDAAPLASFKVDNIRPLVTSLTDDTAGAARSGAAVTYTYQFNKAVSGLAADDFTATNGSVVEVKPDPFSVVLGSVASTSVYTKWAVKVMPTDGVAAGNIGLVLKSGAVTDAAGNVNQEHRQNVQEIDTKAPSLASIESTPKLYLNPSVNNGQVPTGQIRLAFSESVKELSLDDFEVRFGSVVQSEQVRADTLSNLTGSGKDWSVKFTPPADTAVTSVSLTLKGGYVDMAGNPGAAATAPLDLLVNQVNPRLNLALDKVTASGELVYTVEASDAAVTGLSASDFSADNGTVVADSFAPVSGQAGKYNITVKPTATGDVKLKAAADAGVSGALGTLAAESAAIKVVKGTSGDETLKLADGRVFLLEGGNDTITISATGDSPVSAFDTVVGPAAGDKVDITALLNKAGTQAQYFSVVDNTFPGAMPAGWLKTIDRSTASDLGTVGDNELRYMQKVQDSVVTLTFAYDTDSRAGSSTVSESVQLRAVAADTGTLKAWYESDYVILEKIAPTISVAMEGGKTSFPKNSTGTVIFTTNEPIDELPVTALSVAGGSVSAPVQSKSNPLVWTSTFTPTSDATVTAASISVKAGAYGDYQGNAGGASTPLSLMVNQLNPRLTLSLDKVTASGDLVYTVESSDPAVTGLDAADFSAANGTVVAGSFAPVSGQAGKYSVSVAPTATGDVKLSARADAGMGGELGTLAAESAATKVVKGTPGNDTLNLADGRVFLLDAGNDTVKINASADSPVSAFDTVVGVSVGDKFDITALLNKASSPAQYFTAVNKDFTGALPTGWLKTIEASSAGDLSGVADNEMRYLQTVQDNVMTLTFAYDTDSRAGSTTVSDQVQLRVMAADAATLKGWSDGDNIVLEKVAPTISVAMEGGKTSFNKVNPGTATVTFTTSEPISALPSSSVDVVGGTIDEPKQTGPLTWTSKFTPAADATLTAGSISVKNSSYADYEGNTGSASTAVALTLNVPPPAPVLSLEWSDAAPDGTLTFELSSDQALTGLDKSDFSIPGQTILTFQKTSAGSTLPEVYEGTVKPSASGTLALSLPAGVASAVQGLPTPAVAPTDPASIVLTKSAGDGQPIVVSGPTSGNAIGLIVLGSGNETVKITGVGTAAANGEPNFMGVVLGANSGDKFDISPLLSGYTSVATADVPNPANADITISNMKFGTNSGGKQTVIFDLMLDETGFTGASKIIGVTADLAYDYSKVSAIAISSKAIEGGQLLNFGARNAANGLITASNDLADTSIWETENITDASGKLMTVTLTLNTTVNSFSVGFDPRPGSSGGVLASLDGGGTSSLVLGSSRTVSTASVLDGQIKVLPSSETIAADADTPAFGAAPTDNQIKVLQVIESNSVSGQAAKYGSLLFQYDTNPAAGTTTLSPVVQAELISSDVAAFFESNYVKLI